MIFIMRGTSCSGKDTFIGKHFELHNVLSRDFFKLMLLGNLEDQTKNAQVFDFLRQALELRLRFGLPYTVINASNLKFKDCQPYVDMAEKFQCPITFISIDPPTLDELEARNTLRGIAGGQVVTKEVLEKHLNSYYNSMDRFLEVTRKSELLTFVRINQDYEVVNDV